MDRDDHLQFTREALQSQDGKTVPLRLYPGGPVIGKAELRYDPDENALKASFTVDDPKLAENLKVAGSTIILKES